jgi:hypothetical protein
MTVKRVDEGNGSNGDVVEMRIPEPEPKVIIIKDNTDMVKKLKTMKSKIQNNFNENK